MSRAGRTARGAFGALTATLLAAASHGLAGGTLTPLAIVATFLLALPLCVLLAGRIGSLWRLGVGVTAAQLLYHWSFAGLGSGAFGGSVGQVSTDAVSPHLSHAAPISFIPALADAAADSGANEAWMWASHAIAAVLTIALMHRGEQAVVRFIRVLRETMPVRMPQAVRLPQRGAILAAVETPVHRAQERTRSAINRRGPPLRAFSF